MNTWQFILTLVATITGGAVVIATNWISAQVEKRKAIQEWYEQAYITEGIDPIIKYFISLQTHLSNRYTGYSISLADIDVVPVDALAKIYILIDNAILFTIIRLVRAHLTDVEAKELTLYAVSGALVKVCSILLEFREEILCTKVRNKIHRINASRSVMKLRLLAEDLEKMRHIDKK